MRDRLGFDWNEIGLGSSRSRDLWRPNRRVSVRHPNRIQHCQDFGPTVLEPWRQKEVCAELVEGFVPRETARRSCGALDENAARRADVDRMEVITILDLGAIGVAEFLVQSLLLGQRLVVRHIQRHVMRGACAESPAAARPRWLVQQN